MMSDKKLSHFEKAIVALVLTAFCLAGVACGRKDPSTSVKSNRQITDKIQAEDKRIAEEILTAEIGESYDMKAVENQALAARIKGASARIVPSSTVLATDFPIQVQIVIEGLAQPLTVLGPVNAQGFKELSRGLYQCTDKSQQIFTVQAKCLADPHISGPHCSLLSVLVKNESSLAPDKHSQTALLFSQTRDGQYKIKWSAPANERQLSGSKDSAKKAMTQKRKGSESRTRNGKRNGKDNRRARGDTQVVEAEMSSGVSCTWQQDVNAESNETEKTQEGTIDKATDKMTETVAI